MMDNEERWRWTNEQSQRRVYIYNDSTYLRIYTHARRHTHTHSLSAVPHCLVATHQRVACARVSRGIVCATQCGPLRGACLSLSKADDVIVVVVVVVVVVVMVEVAAGEHIVFRAGEGSGPDGHVEMLLRLRVVRTHVDHLERPDQRPSHGRQVTAKKPTRREGGNRQSSSASVKNAALLLQLPDATGGHRACAVVTTTTTTTTTTPTTST